MPSRRAHRLSLADLPPRARAQAEAQLAAAYTPATIAAEGPHRLRQKQGDGMNKTERRFFEHLQAALPHAHFVKREALHLRIANGSVFKPDFAVHDSSGLWFYEVKGFMRDDAAGKIKAAATIYPSFFFVLVWWDRKALTWVQQRIHP